MLKTLLAAAAAIAASSVALPAFAQCGGDQQLTLNPDGTTTCGEELQPPQPAWAEATAPDAAVWTLDFGTVEDELLAVGAYVEVWIEPDPEDSYASAVEPSGDVVRESDCSEEVFAQRRPPSPGPRPSPSGGRSRPKEQGDDRNRIVQTLEALKDAADAMAGSSGGSGAGEFSFNGTMTATTVQPNGARTTTTIRGQVRVQGRR